MENSADLIFLVDHEGRVMEHNAAAERIFGPLARHPGSVDLAELILDGADYRRFSEYLMEFVRESNRHDRGGIPLHEFNLRCADGVARIGEMRITRIGAEYPPIFAIAIRDVTERRRAEADLLRLNALLTQIIAVTGDVVGVKDLNLRYVLANDALADVHDCKPADLVGRRLADFIGDAAIAIEDDERRVLREARVHESEYMVPRGDSARHYHVTKNVYRDRDGQVAGLVFIGRDITERKRAEEASFFLAEASRALSATTDEAAMLGKAAWLAIPFLADGCIIDRVGPDGKLYRKEAVHRSPDLISAMLTSRPGEHSRRVARERVSVQVGSIQTACMGELTYLGVPIIARGRLLGVLSLLRNESTRSAFTAREQSVAEEFALQIAAALETAGGPDLAAASESAGITVDPISFRVLHDGRESPSLTQREFQVFQLLHGAPERRMTRFDLIRGVWGNFKVSSNSLDVHLFRLRRKLQPVGVEIIFDAPNVYRLA